MKNSLSWWEYEHLLKDVDHTVVGCGIVGLSTAIELKSAQPACKVLVLDKKKSPLGASTKNAGFACFGSISEILDDYNSYGQETCIKLIRMRWQGLSILKSRIPAKKMMYESKPGAEIFTDNVEKEFYKNKLAWVNSLVAPIVGIEDCFYFNKGRFGFQIINKLEGSLNPQMMIRELELIARKLGVIFLSGIEVEEINFEDKFLTTNLGRIDYNKLAVCTNGFSRRLLPLQDIKPARNQVLITNRIPGFGLDNCYHMNKGYVYFRAYDGRLLIGGGRHLDKTGETTEDLETTEFIISYLSDLISNSILPGINYKIEHSWSGILGVGGSKLPIVKKLDENVTIAIRMGGMGVAVGSFIGKVAVSTILSNSNSEQELYVS
jgi:gamma-glutamylputrescine oxidase